MPVCTCMTFIILFIIFSHSATACFAGMTVFRPFDTTSPNIFYEIIFCFLRRAEALVEPDFFERPRPGASAICRQSICVIRGICVNHFIIISCKNNPMIYLLCTLFVFILISIHLLTYCFGHGVRSPINII